MKPSQKQIEDILDVSRIKSFDPGFPREMEKTGVVWFDEMQKELFIRASFRAVQLEELRIADNPQFGIFTP